MTKYLKYYVGIDLGGTNIKAGLVDQDGRVLSKLSIPTEASGGPDVVIERMCRAGQEAIDKAQITKEHIRAIGIGAPGSLDHKSGVILEPPNLPGWHNVPVRDRIFDHFKIPATLENDGNAAGWGEFWVGAGKNADSLVIFTLGTGIGGGIVYDGKFVRGHFDNGAEIGHMIVEPGGRPCGCGQRGCFESNASASHIAKIALEAIEAGAESSMKQIIDQDGEITSELILKHKLQGDKLAGEIWNDTCRYIAIASINMAHIMNTELIVLAGGMIYAGEHLLEPVREFYEQLRGPVFGQTYARIVLAELGNDAGFIGAAGAANLADQLGELE